MNNIYLACNKAEKSEGLYTNYFKIGYNAFEFVLDFGQFFPEKEEVVFFSRVITNPKTAKNLAQVLHVSIAQYEKIYGLIKITDNE